MTFMMLIDLPNPIELQRRYLTEESELIDVIISQINCLMATIANDECSRKILSDYCERLNLVKENFIITKKKLVSISDEINKNQEEIEKFEHENAEMFK